MSALSPVMQTVLVSVGIFAVLIGFLAYVTLLERKFAARMQSRIGPYRVGPHGLLQPIADALKLMMKEDIVPAAADRTIYNLAPIVFLVPCMLIFATIPFAPGLGVGDLNIGILFFLAVSSMEIVGLFMAGWGSNNKYALLSTMRAVNQIISYDLPFLMAALVPVLLAGSLRMTDIAVAQQGLWFIAYPVLGQLGFLMFVISGVAAENRTPSDLSANPHAPAPLRNWNHNTPAGLLAVRGHWGRRRHQPPSRVTREPLRFGCEGRSQMSRRFAAMVQDRS